MSDDAAVQETERVDPLSLFSPQVRTPVYGLAFIGHIQKDIEFCGHTFTIKTLRPGDKAAIAVAVQPWRDTVEEPVVWANATVGMALISVDGDTDFCPKASPNINELAKARLYYVTNPEDGWYAPTLGYLYEQFLELEAEALEATKELQNLSPRSRTPSPPSPDSLTVQDTSGAPVHLDIQP